MRLITILFFFTIFLYSCKVDRSDRFESVNFELVKLGDGVYSCIHKFGGKAICNVGIVDNGEETIIFDSFLSPDVAKELLEVLKEMDLSPLKYVVNSHSHNDHIRGNQVFSADVKIISTTKTAELIREWEPLDIAEEKKYAPARFSYYDSLFNSFNGDKLSREYQQILMWRPYYETLSNSYLEIKTRLPDTFVDTIQNFDGPNRSLQLITKGMGHTESDLMLYLPDDEILFTGDLVFNACHPYLAHGSIRDLDKQLNFMDSLSITTVVPGHGQIGSKDIIATMREYILSVESLAAEMNNQELTIEDLETIEIPEKYKNWWFDRFFLSNVKFAYSKLNEK
jgi:glyoxylase-like metal-dependent hydrolase (beta-lactamase superfamily II)